jgi:hypothetical protein
MASYLRGWFSLDIATAPNPPSNSIVVPEILEVSPPPLDDDGEDTAGEDDVPPIFPALGSAQRAASSSSNDSLRVLTDSQLMPPPPPPNLASRQPGTLSLGVRTSASSSLAVPLTTTKRPTLSPKKREKVALAPGHSPLDWASLKASGADLRVSYLELSRSMPPDHCLTGC